MLPTSAGVYHHVRAAKQHAHGSPHTAGAPVVTAMRCLPLCSSCTSCRPCHGVAGVTLIPIPRPCLYVATSPNRYLCHVYTPVYSNCVAADVLLGVVGSAASMLSECPSRPARPTSTRQQTRDQRGLLLCWQPANKKNTLHVTPYPGPLLPSRTPTHTAKHIALLWQQTHCGSHHDDCASD